MPGLTTSDDATSSSPPYTHRLRHGLTQPISRLSISWTRGNSLRVSVLSGPSSEEGGKAMEVCLDGGGNDGAEWRRIVYGSVTPFALLQSRKNSGDDWTNLSFIGKNYYTKNLLRHGLTQSIPRLSISWTRGNSLHVSVLSSPSSEKGGKAMEVCLDGGGDGGSEWRMIVYGSVAPFVLLQRRKNSGDDWWEYVMEYSRDISLLLGGQKPPTHSLIEDPNTVLKNVEEPTCLRAAWELIEIFYADKQCQAWIPERLLDWVADYDSLLSATQPTVHSNLVDFQKELASLQAVEDDSRYWKAVSSAAAIGWLDVAVKMLRMHGSYQLDQLGNREIENGLVEAVSVLITNMPRLCPQLAAEKLGTCCESKHDFIKAWEKWRGQLTKLECSAFWVQCDHLKTREGLKSLLQILLGNIDVLTSATYNWIELLICQLLYVRPLTMGLESLYSLAKKCMQLKQTSSSHKLMELLIGILEDNTEVVLAECSKSFGPWMVAHAVELLAAGSSQADIILREERNNLGGISMEELHRLVYAQVLSSHALTWQIAPIYLASCVKQGMGLLEILLLQQPVQHSRTLLKTLEICRMYELDSVASKIMKIAGVHNWKHGKKGAGVFWLQRARDEVRLNRIAQQLFDFVGKSFSDEGFKEWEGLIELLGAESRTAGGLEFLHKYRDFKKSLQQVHDGISSETARKTAESLILLMRNPSTPQRFWLPLLYDSLTLLNWKQGPLLNTSQTNLLLNKLQELSMARLRPDFIELQLPSQALSSIRLALANNLGRTILEE